MSSPSALPRDGEQQLHAEADAEHRLRQLRDRFDELQRMQPLPWRRRRQPTPGRITRGASRSYGGVGGHVRRRRRGACSAERSEAMLAPPLSMMATTSPAAPHSTPLVLGSSCLRRAKRLAQRAADALEAGFDHVVRVLAL